jgi:hypothetical protein
MPLLLALLLATSFPSTNRTSWMRPEAFRLAIGMSRTAALAELETSGWKTKNGADGNHVDVDYADDKAVTLEFNHDRLHALRFQLFAILPESHDAFEEEKSYLRKTLGQPRSNIKSKTIVLYDHTLPNVMVVLSADPKSETGQKGLGLLVVRYFDPVPMR